MKSKGILLVCLVFVSSALAQPAAPAAVRGAVAKPLKVLLNNGIAWYEKQQCSSCHHQALPLMAFGLARQRGVPVPEDQLRLLAAKSLNYLTSVDMAVQGADLVDPPLADSYFLVAAQELGIPANLPFAARLRFIASRQQADGRWNTLDVRPPQSASAVTATAVTIRAMRSYLRSYSPQDSDARVRRAAQWMRAATPANTEERVFQLLGLHWSGASAPDLLPLREALLSDQRPDGGWSQAPYLPSDAYSTGEALYALHVAGTTATDHPAYQKGVRFLLDSQLPDGTWLVRTRLRQPAPLSPPYFETGFPHGLDQFSSANGTTWATIALLLTLPPNAIPAAPVPLPALTRVTTPAWAKTVLFGSLSDLKRLLDQGLSANSHTAEGVTVLMMAANDADKVKLLLERGADVNAKSKARYTALLVAASYGGTTEVVRQLLERKAEVEANPGQNPLYNASPVFLAAWSGEAATVDLLAKHGANLSRRMLMGGVAEISPMEIAVAQRDNETIRALVRNGLDVNTKNREGLTALSWAAMMGLPGQVQQLIALGADVNHSDTYDMTPLLWASLIDMGNYGSIEVLLKAGADTRVRTKQGESALALAKKWQQPDVARVLKKAGVEE